MQSQLIFERFKEYLGVLNRRKWLVILGALLTGALMALYAWQKPVYFTSTTVLHPDNDSQPSISIDNPISMFLGGGMTTGEASQMSAVLESRNLSEAVAADSSLYDWVLKEYDPGWSFISMVKGWFKGPPEPLSDKIKIFQAGKIIRNNLQVNTTEEGLIKMLITTPSVALTRAISDRYLKELNAYYHKQKTEKATRNVDFFVNRADSVYQELEKVNRKIARLMDQRYVISAQPQVLPQELSAQQEILKQMYITLIINREQAISQRLQETPAIQVMDYPHPPFKPEGTSSLMYFIAGLILGLGLMILLFCRKMIRKDVEDIFIYTLQPPSKESD